MYLGSQQAKDVAKRGDHVLLFEDEPATLKGKERQEALEGTQVRADTGNGVYCACWKALFHNFPDDNESIEHAKTIFERASELKDEIKGDIIEACLAWIEDRQPDTVYLNMRRTIKNFISLVHTSYKSRCFSSTTPWVPTEDAPPSQTPQGSAGVVSTRMPKIIDDAYSHNDSDDDDLRVQLT